MEDLEFNPFYKALQNQFQALFDRAQDECWLVCIPCSSSLPSKSHITYSFAEAHLLEPSKMLRDEYNTLVGGKRIHWKLNNNKLICPDRGTEVEVIAEELAYNKKYSQYRLFVVSAPLVGGKGGQQKKEKGMTKEEDLFAPRRTLSEHLQLLKHFQKHTEIFTELKKRLDMFNNNYMILEDFLMDASNRLETLLKNGYSSYFTEHSSTDERVHDRRIQEAIWLAVESQIMGFVHAKVYPMVCSKYQRDDKQFVELCRQLKSTFTPAVLNLSSDYHCQYPITLTDLRRLPRLELPLEKLYCLQDAMDSIYKDVDNHFKSRLRIGEPALLQSDDLIPLLATILVQANLKMLISDINYIEMFHWSPSDSNKLSFVLVTVRAAVEYIRGPDVRKYLPAKPKQQPIAASVPSSSSPFVVSSPLFNQYDDVGNGLSSTLSKLASLNVKADQIERQQKQSSNELGPFFGSLEDGKIVSSKQYSS